MKRRITAASVSFAGRMSMAGMRHSTRTEGSSIARVIFSKVIIPWKLRLIEQSRR
jgi:hypothetical protein